MRFRDGDTVTYLGESDEVDHGAPGVVISASSDAAYVRFEPDNTIAFVRNRDLVVREDVDAAS